MVVPCFSLSWFSPSFTSPLPHSTCSLPGTPSSMSTPPRVKTAAPPHNEECCTMAIYHHLTGCEPNVLDDFHYSETSAMIFQDESADLDTEPSYLCDVELDDGDHRQSALFTNVHQEREEPANLRQAFNSYEESLLPAQSFFRTQVRGDPYSNLVRLKNGNQVATWKTKESGFSLIDKKSKFSLQSELRSRSMTFKPILIEEVSRN